MSDGKIFFTGLLVAEGAIGEEEDIGGAGIQEIFYEVLMVFELVEVGGDRVDMGGTVGGEIGGHYVELRLVLVNEGDVGLVLSEESGSGLADSGGTAKDNDFFRGVSHGYIIS